MSRKLTAFALHFRWPVLLGMALVTYFFAQALLDLEIDPSTESLFIKSSEEYRLYREFNEQFGSDYMVAIAMETPDLFKDPYLQDLREITETIGSYSQAERVISLSNVMDIKHKFMGIKIVPALEKYYKKDETASEAKKSILSNEIFRNNLVSPDGRIANILVFLKSTGEKNESSGQFIGRLQKLLKKYERNQMKFYIAGAPVEQYQFIRDIRRDQIVFVPAITLLLIVTTLLIYRSFWCMTLAMSIVFMSLVWTIGSIVVLGQEMNLVTSLLAPVIMIVAIVNSIHLMNLFFEIRVHQKSLSEAVKLTMEQLGVPCFLTHFTTIVGFLSLALNPVPAIQSFGLFAALGTFFSYIIEMVMTPILLPILPYRQHVESPREHFFNRFLIGFLEKLEFRWKWWILFVTGLVIVFSILGIRKLQVDTSLIKQMKPDSPLAVATRFIDDNLTGVYSLGFVLRKKDGSSIVDYDSLNAIEGLNKYLEAQPEIVKVNTITSLIKKINEARENEPEGFKIPESENRISRYFDGIKTSQDPDLWKMITPDFKQVRLDARMKAVGTREGAAMEERVTRYLEKHLSKDFEYHLTGNVVLLGKMAKGLVKYQMEGFFSAFVVILISITAMFRSLRLGLLAAVPNLIPILAIYGFMGFLKIELSSPTAMISSIVLGMVVDASIHFLHRFKLEFAQRHHYIQALHHTFRNCGQSLVVSTSILCAGFASSIFASFKPTIHLGLLTSLTILFALLCTLVILPVCLVMVRPFGSEKMFKRRRKRPARRSI